MNKKSLMILFFLSFYSILTYPMHYHYYGSKWQHDSMKHENVFTGYRPPLTTGELKASQECWRTTIESGSSEEVMSKRCCVAGSGLALYTLPTACIGLLTPPVPLAGIIITAIAGGLAMGACGCSYCYSKDACTNALRCNFSTNPEERRSLVQSQPGMH